MKKMRIFLPMVLLFLAVSCKMDEGMVKKAASGNDVLEARLESSADDETRVTLKNKVNPVWTSADVITVVGTKSTDFTLSSGAGTTSGKFTGSVSEAGTEPYFAVFPQSEDAALTGDGLSFSIDKERGASTNNIKSNVLPMVADVRGSSMQFHNLFGLLKISLKSDTDVKIKKMTLHDLGGNLLWGTCTVPIHADTLAYNEMTLEGGDNSTSIVWGTNVTITQEAKSFYFCIPAGALDHGFSIVLYEYDTSVEDNVGRAYTFLQKVSSSTTAERSVIINIDEAQITEKSEPLDEKARGYYKTLFVDGGYKLNHLVDTVDLPWVNKCGLGDDFEYVSCSNTTTRDTITCRGILVSAPQNTDVNWNDENGVLLYPDGKPRFRAVFVNGGSSTNHGEYLRQEGRDHFHDFYYKGGSYIAVCAGTFLATKWVDGVNCYNNADESQNFTFGIWPGELYHTKIPVNSSTYGSVYTAMKAETAFGDFAAGDTIELVRHHGGSYLPNTYFNATRSPQPERFFVYKYTEDPAAGTDSTLYTYKNLITYKNLGSIRTKKDSTSVWAYKNSSTTGRAVLCGSHPENNTSDKQVTLMKNMLEYALEGSGAATLKGTLTLGSKREMNTDWSAGTPSYAKIGDRQYHHFKFTASSDIKNFTLTLDSDYDADSGIDLYLSMRKGGAAWISDSDYVLCNAGGKKVFDIKNLPAGTWYIGVYCASTVTATRTDATSYRRFFKYSGHTETQNGIAYSIIASQSSL